MAFKTIFAPLAKEDLNDVTEYLIQQGSIQFSQNVKNSLKIKLDELCKEPKLYQIATEPILKQKEIRIIPLKGYLIYYKIDEQKEAINIVRIRNERQNNQKIKV